MIVHMIAEKLNHNQNMIRALENTIVRRLGSFRPQFNSQRQRGLYWAPRQYFLPESESVKMKRLMVDKGEQGMQSALARRSNWLWRHFKYGCKLGLYLMVVGTRQFIGDAKWVWSLLTNSEKRKQMTGWEIKEINRISWDMVKYMPYIILLSLPGGELVLPVYMYLLPNSSPSYFTFDKLVHEDTLEHQIKQQKAFERLFSKFQKVLVHTRNKEVLLDPEESQKLFRKNREVVNNKLDFHKFTSDELMDICNFYGMKPIQGTGLINRVVNLFTEVLPRILYKIYRSIRYKKGQAPPYSEPKWIVGNFKFLRFNYFPFEFFKRNLLIFQIQRHLTRVGRQDAAFQANGFHSLTKQRVVHFTRDRGLIKFKCYKAAINFYIEDWIFRTNNADFNNNARLWYSVMMHSFLKVTPDFYIEPY